MFQLLTVVNFSTHRQLLRGVFTFLSVRSFSQSEYSFKEELCALQGKEDEWRLPLNGLTLPRSEGREGFRKGWSGHPAALAFLSWTQSLVGI